MQGTETQRPRVVILGGGFAGIGAARKLEEADVDVVLVDKHDYHTFQPLLYQVATGLLEPSTVGHSLRDLFREQDNLVDPSGHRDRDRPRRPRGAVRRDGAPDLRLPRAGARRRGQLLRHRGRRRARLPHVHAPRRAAAPRSTCCSAGRRRTGTARSSTTARSTSSSSAAARPGSRARARWPSSTGTSSSRTIRSCPRRRRASSSSRQGRTSSPCSSRTSATTRGRRSRSAASSSCSESSSPRSPPHASR